MIYSLLKKLLSGSVLLVALIAVCLALLRNVPGGPFDSERIASPEVQAAMQARFGINASYTEQLGKYLKGLLKFDFGPSFQYSDFTVAELLANALPITLMIGSAALVMAWLSATLLAVFAVDRAGTKLDFFISTLSTSLLSTPKFVTAPLLAMIFAAGLGWLPSAGLGEPLWKYLLLPAAALALTQFGVALRVMRGALKDAQASDAVKAGRARGFNATRLRWRHLLPIALPSALAFLLPSAVAVLTGSAVVEQVFALPGLGRALVSSALNRDYMLLLGVVVCSGVIVLVLGWLIELLLATVDPRRRGV
jgi:oligopeptide transport system permease protein